MKILNEEMFERLLARAVEEDMNRELEKLDAEMAKIDLEKEIRFSRSHKRIMKYIFKHGCKPPPRKVVFKKVMKRVSVCLSAMLVLALCSCLCFPTVRADMKKMFVDFYEGYLGISDGGNAVITKAMEHHVPTYIPEGYELYRDESTMYWGMKYYINEEANKKIWYSQYFNKLPYLYFDSEGAMLSDVLVNEYEGKYLEYIEKDKTENVIMWIDGDYTYYIMGELSYEELKAMAESVS